MNAFTLKSLYINNPVLAGRPVSQHAACDSPHHVWLFVCADVRLGAAQVLGGGLWRISTVVDASSAVCACVWAMCPGVGGRRAIPPPCSGFIWCGRGQSEELFPGTYPALLLP